MSKLSIIALLITLLILQCQHNSEPRQPIALAIINDFSMSATKNKVPLLTESMVDQLIGIVQKSGGEISYLPLNQHSFSPALRLVLEPIQGKTLKEQAILYQRQAKGINAFKQAISKSLSRKRKATRTDYWGAIKRVNRIYHEEAIHVAPRRILLAITDAEDDARKHKPMTLPEDVTVVVVGNTNKKAIINLSTHVKVFEGLEAAISFINHLAGE